MFNIPSDYHRATLKVALVDLPVCPEFCVVKSTPPSLRVLGVFKVFSIFLFRAGSTWFGGIDSNACSPSLYFRFRGDKKFSFLINRFFRLFMQFGDFITYLDFGSIIFLPPDCCTLGLQ